MEYTFGGNGMSSIRQVQDRGVPMTAMAMSFAPTVRAISAYSRGLRRLFLGLALALGLHGVPAAKAEALSYGWQKVDGVNLFYREGGPRDAPTIVFLHGTPASSLMYQPLMERLADLHALHLLAVDYPSYGFSDAPDRASYPYTFDHLADTVRKFLQARGIVRYALYMQDYGVPVGFRLISAAPESITAVMVQNGVIHLDGFPMAQDENGELRRYWRQRNVDVDRRGADSMKSPPFPQAANWDEGEHLPPEVVQLDNAVQQRLGVIDARNDLWFDYGSNLAHYLAWQALLRQLKVPVLVLWGSGDNFFTVPGALAYLRDAPQAEVHILQAGHFASLEVPDQVSPLVLDFVKRNKELAAQLVPAAH